MLTNLPIETAHLIIGELKLADADDLFAFMNLPEIMEFIPDRFEDKEELQEVLDWLIGNYRKAKSEIVRLTMAIRKKDGGDFVGWVSCGPLPYDEELKEIAYAIDPKYWNLGYATSATKRFLEWLRDNITTEDIYAEIDEKNVKSGRVLEKLKFVKIKEDKVHRDGFDKKVWIYRWAD